MSRRAIKKYEQELEADRLNVADSETTENKDEEFSLNRNSRPQGLFALLGEDGDSDGDSSENANKTEDEVVAQEADSGKGSSTVVGKGSVLEALSEEDLKGKEGSDPTKAGVPGKKKRKKRKKGKKNQEVIVDQENDPDWIALNEASKELSVEDGDGYIPDSYFASDDGEDVRTEAVRIMAKIESMVLQDAETLAENMNVIIRHNAVLRVEPRLLNADSELKRLFGSRVIESEKRADEASNATRRRGRAGVRAAGRRKVSLVSPRETWFPEAPGLVMVLDTEMTSNSLNGVKYYRYKHEASYARIQDEYRVRVSTHDPNQLVELFSLYPFHVDTMLQLAEVYRQMGELDQSAEQVERCLYVLETSWNIGFKPFDGSCRLPFHVMENRALYLGLFRYSQLLTRRGLHRTALEISKLLLNLDPEKDPMGVLMMADSFALLSGEYEWIGDMTRDFDSIPINYFPNFAASAALAKESIKLRAGETSNRSGSSKGKGSSARAKAETEDDDEDSAEEMLVDALLTFPMLLQPLLSGIQDESGAWAEHRLYDESWYKAGYEDYGVLERMSRVYAERSKLVWNSAKNKELLVRCARKAGSLDTAAGMGKDRESGGSTPALVSDVTKHDRVARCRSLRAEAGAWLGRGALYKDVVLADFVDSTTNLPAEILAGDAADQAVGAEARRRATAGESAWEFLQSLLPWRNVNDLQ